jgi:hypothetical protein
VVIKTVDSTPLSQAQSSPANNNLPGIPAGNPTLTVAPTATNPNQLSPIELPPKPD